MVQPVPPSDQVIKTPVQDLMRKHVKLNQGTAADYFYSKDEFTQTMYLTARSNAEKLG